MFFTLIQETTPDGAFLSERFTCFEADSRTEAEVRAEWFGIDLQEKFDHGNNAYHRWWWHNSSCETTNPRISGSPLEESDYEWIILYKDGNLKSSSGILLGQQDGMTGFDEVDY